jgi:hypothetical protein
MALTATAATYIVWFGSCQIFFYTCNLHNEIAALKLLTIHLFDSCLSIFNLLVGLC